MCNKQFLIVVMLAAIVVGGGTHATAITVNYFNGTVDDNFVNPGNWTNGSPEGKIDYIHVGHNVNLTSPYEPPGWYVVYQLHLGCADLDFMNTLNMNEGLVGIEDYFAIGALWSAVGDGTLNMNAGTINTKATYVGYGAYGVINMIDGVFESWHSFQMGGSGGTGLVNLDGGLLHLTDITMYEGSSIVITNGTLQVDGFWGNPVPKVNQYIANGWITAGDRYALHTELFDNGGGGQGIKVTATAIPPTLGFDDNDNTGRVFEENGNKWVLWGFEGNIWGCEYGNYFLWERLCQASVYVNANCIVLPVAWLMVEPTEDNYSFTHLDWYLNTAYDYDLKVLIMWAGLGYAGVSIEFCPDYIQNDTATYMRCQGLDNHNVLCPSDPDTLLREKLAYRAVMNHLATINPSLENIVMGVNIGSELDYIGALHDYWWDPETPTETNRRCTCSYCNAAYTPGQNNIEFMTEQCAKYLAELIDYGAQGYDIPAYTPVCGHQYWNEHYNKGWRYAEDPHVFKNYVAQKQHISNHWVCPSIAETNNAADYILKDLNYFLGSQITGNTIFVDGIDGGWSGNQPHIELAPWENIFWYGSMGACYWDSTHMVGSSYPLSIMENNVLREKLRTFWGPLLGMHYHLARLKTTQGIGFWWQYFDTNTCKGLVYFGVAQQSSAVDYGVCYELGPSDIAFSGTTYGGSYTVTICHGYGWSGFKFEKGYFDRLTGNWIKDSNVYPTINGENAVLTVSDNPGSGDYTKAVYRYYK